MASHPKISAAIATFNEEKNIVDCLDSLKDFVDEIVVVDGNSTDKTRQFAKASGARVIKTQNNPMFHKNKNLAIENCQGEWILLIDADERVSFKLAKEIKEVISKKPQVNGFRINRRNWFLGGFLKKGGAYPDSVIRLIRRGYGRLPEKSVHEQIKLEGKVANLKNDLIHFADPSFARYLERVGRYTSQTAEEIKKETTKDSARVAIKYILLKPAKTFFSLYFRHRGYADGFRGFIWAFFSSAHYFIAYVKYWQSFKRSR